MPPKLASNRLTPNSNAVHALETAILRVLCKCKRTGIFELNNIKGLTFSFISFGTATPIVSAREISSGLRSKHLSAISNTRDGLTSPANGQPKAAAIDIQILIPVFLFFSNLEIYSMLSAVVIPWFFRLNSSEATITNVISSQLELIALE